MKQIYIKVDTTQDNEESMQLIDAGVDSYHELTDAPIKTTYNGVTLVGSSVENGVVIPATDPADIHKWSAAELLSFCESAQSGRYDIITEEMGTEILMIDNTDAGLGRRYRRITADQDLVYDINDGWISISNQNNISILEETRNNPVREEDLVEFCESLPDGRYDIFTEKNGPEWLFIDRTKGTKDEPNRFRRITLDSDLIYSYLAGGEWVYISDKNAKQLVASIVNYNEINNKMVVVGSKVTIDCYYYSTYGPGVINIYDKNGMLKFSSGIISGETIKADVSNYIVDGDQSFRVIISNESDANDLNMLVGITGIQLTYKPIFNQYSANFTGNVQFSFEYYGTGNKQTYFEVNGEPVVFSSGVNSYPNASGSDTVTIPANYFSTGENTIKTYLYIEDNGELVTKTDEVIYRIPWWDTAENTTPIVMTYFTFDNIKEYDTISIPYYIWAKSAAQKINLSLEYEQDGVLKSINQLYTDENEAHKINYLTQNTEHNWQLSNLPWGNLTFKIYLNDSTEPEFVSNTISVEKSKIDLGPTKGGLVLNFLPTDITSTDAITEWSDGLGNVMKLNGLNWQTDGFKTDEDSNKALIFSTNASATIEGFRLFSTNGFSFEIDYMVHDAIVETKPIIRYGHMNATETRLYGIDVYPIRTVFNVDGSANKGEDYVLNFQKGERVHLMYVYENGSGTSRYVKLYINGILSLIEKLPSIGDSMAQPEDITINLQSNTISLYALRAYNKALSSKEVIQNYASNFGSVDKKTELIRLNNVYTNSDTDNPRQLSCVDGNGTVYNFPGESFVKYEAVKGKISTFVVIAEALPTSKLYVPFDKIIFDDLGPTNDGTTKWITWAEQDLNEQKGNVFQGQGTSSLVYPRKNFKFKFKKKLQIKGDGLVNEKGKPISGAEKNFTFKCDYMDSSGANNIGNAIVTQNSIRAEDWAGTPIAEGARLNLDGFPVAMFWAKEYETNEKGENIPVNPEYIGTYNFNYDKKIKSVGRYEDENYPFQGFEFRNNTSTECLQKGIRNLTAFMSGDDGYEWRWTPLSDWIDDYHDKKNLPNTMQGGLFTTTDTPDGKYITNIHTDADYLYDRTLSEDDDAFKEITRVPAYSAWYWSDGNKKHRLYYIDTNNLYKEFDYRQIPGCSNDVFEVEYGIRVIGGKIYWQVPYGQTSTSLGKLYPDEEIEPEYRTKYPQGYYEFELNDKHAAQFKLFKHCNYYKNLENWTELISAEQLYYKQFSQANDSLGEYLLDKDGEYYRIVDYPHYNYNEETQSYEYVKESGTHIQIEAGEFIALVDILIEDTYNLEWVAVQTEDLTDDSLVITDLQKEIFKNWFYCVDVLSHCDSSNYKQLIDSGSEDPKNGHGLFKMSALLNYFVSSLTTAICDNFCKNMFMHTYDGGMTWVPAWYDMDTAYGLNNVGLYAYNYDIDFDNGLVDEYGVITKAGSFNGSDSTLWSLFYSLYSSSIESEYSILRTADKISYNKIMDVLYGENIKYKFPALYNANAFYRYIIPDILQMSDNHLEAGQGSRYELLKYWNKNREYYIESRYNGGSFVDNKITLRLNCNEAAQFNLTPSVNMYVGVAIDNQNATIPAVRSEYKILAGQTWNHTTDRKSFSDTNTYIFGANNLLDVGDMGQWVLTTCQLETATNLQRINLGMKKGSFAYNTYQTSPKIKQYGQTVTLSQLPYNNLTELNLENCNKLVNTRLDFSTIGPVLKNVVLTGSNVQQIQFAAYSPLKSVYYPATLNVVKLVNLPELETVEFESYENLTGINIKGTPNFDSLNLLTELYSQGFINNLNSINADLYGTYDTAIDFDMLKDLYDKKAELGGVVYVKHVNEEELEPYREYWKAHGGLVIEWYQIFHSDAILGIEGESSAQVSRTYGAKGLTNNYAYKNTFAVINDFDSTLLGQKIVIEDEVNHPGWIKINPFYTRYLTNDTGEVIGREISEFKIGADYRMNPIFIDEQGVAGPIYIAKYLSGFSNGDLVNKSGVRPYAQTPVDWHDQLQDLNTSDELYRYTVETIWTRQLLQDLIAIEFARTDMSNIIPGSPKITTTGSTDTLNYHTGINANESGDHNVSFKYRGLEDIWRGGTGTYVQGIQNSNGWLKVTTHDYFSTNLDSWEQLDHRPGSGVRYIKSYVNEIIDDKYNITVPNKTSTSKTDIYIDQTYNDQSNNEIVYTSCGGGEYDMSHGLWSMNYVNSGSTKLYGRLVRRYKDNRITSLTPEEE